MGKQKLFDSNSFDHLIRIRLGIPASKQNDDSPIELHVEAKAQWNLLRKDTSIEIQAPLSSDNWLLKNRWEIKDNSIESDASDNDERWLSQVEIVTSSGPHRRLWMGPQFIFKTYNTPSGYYSLTCCCIAVYVEYRVTWLIENVRLVLGLLYNISTAKPLKLA